MLLLRNTTAVQGDRHDAAQMQYRRFCGARSEQTPFHQHRPFLRQYSLGMQCTACLAAHNIQQYIITTVMGCAGKAIQTAPDSDGSTGLVPHTCHCFSTYACHAVQRQYMLYNSTFLLPHTCHSFSVHACQANEGVTCYAVQRQCIPDTPHLPLRLAWVVVWCVARSEVHETNWYATVSKHKAICCPTMQWLQLQHIRYLGQ